MKYVYPAIFYKTEDKVPYFVQIPDLDAMTQGTSLENAIEMAREIVCISIVELQKKNKPIPPACEIGDVEVDDENAIISLVDADVDAYKRRMESRCIRKNCTIPIWLNDEAEKAGINFSSVLQQGLKAILGINS